MDPLTQGVLGAALPQATVGRQLNIKAAATLGFVAGMAADLDVFIRSSRDPLLFLEYHRHFTHSLIFIPVGGLMCAAALYWILARRWRLSFRQTLLVCTLGYGTHAILDAMTSYGTLLYWPFSDRRVSLSVIAIIDPLFTLPLMAAVILAAYLRKPLVAGAGLAWASFYLLVGFLQQSSATSMMAKTAAARGHEPLRIEAKPSFGNILIWKTIYETRDGHHIDAVRAGLAPRVFEGATLPKLDLPRDLPWLDPDSQQGKDIERFRYFSQGLIALDPSNANQIMDVRYSFLPNDAKPLWSIAVSPDVASTAHATYVTHRRQARENLRGLWQLATTP